MVEARGVEPRSLNATVLIISLGFITRYYTVGVLPGQEIASLRRYFGTEQSAR